MNPLNDEFTTRFAGNTISVKIVELGDQNGEEKPVLTIKADVKAHDNDLDYGRAYWRSEVAKIIKSVLILISLSINLLLNFTTSSST